MAQVKNVSGTAFVVAEFRAKENEPPQQNLWVNFGSGRAPSV